MTTEDFIIGLFCRIADLIYEENPTNLKICKRGSWNVRMIVETVLSMLTTVCHFKRVSHRVWNYFKARLAYTVAACNILVQWHGFIPDENGSSEERAG